MPVYTFTSGVLGPMVFFSVLGIVMHLIHLYFDAVEHQGNVFPGVLGLVFQAIVLAILLTVL